jgi:hypothetical protein
MFVMETGLVRSHGREYEDEVSWDVAPYSLVEIALIEAVHTSTIVTFYQTMHCNIPKDIFWHILFSLRKEQNF